MSQKGPHELSVSQSIRAGHDDEVRDALSPLGLLSLGCFSCFALSPLTRKKLPRLQLGQTLGRTGDSFVVMVRCSHADPLWSSNQ